MDGGGGARRRLLVVKGRQAGRPGKGREQQARGGTSDAPSLPISLDEAAARDGDSRRAGRHDAFPRHTPRSRLLQPRLEEAAALDLELLPLAVAPARRDVGRRRVGERRAAHQPARARHRRPRVELGAERAQRRARGEELAERLSR